MPYAHPAPLAPTVAKLRDGQHSLSLYIEQVCDRIALVEPHVQALLPEAGRARRLQAAARDLRNRYATGEKPPLYGALVGVKDIFHVEGFVTRANSDVPPEKFAGDEAAVVQRLRDAGALILGKTVTTEFAYFAPGPTRNPVNSAHTPGGSSSGSAAAVAAGLCMLALGTQTIGSVIRPAAFCGIVGFKPTFDRIPTQGLVYFSRTVDHVGLFTQDVAGMALAASALCNGWDAAVAAEMAEELPTLGVPDGSFLRQAEPEARYLFEEAMIALGQQGVDVRRVPTLDDIDALNALHRRLIFREFADEHVGFFDEFAASYKPQTRQAIETGRTVGDEELAAARTSTGERRESLTAQMDAAAIDLWASPAAPGPAPEGLHATGDPNLNLPWTHAGLPTVTIPMGTAQNGLPLGLQLTARFGEDEQLLAWAEQLSRLIQQN